VTNPVDCVIILALAEEFAAFLKIFKTGPPAEFPTETYYPFQFRDAKSETRSGVVTFIGGVGPELAGFKADRAIARYAPSLVAIIGISGALSDDVRLGDIVFADDVDNYSFRGKVSDDDDSLLAALHWGGRSSPGDPELLDRVKNLPFQRALEYARWNKATRRHLARCVPPETEAQLRTDGLLHEEVKLQVGPAASGPFVSVSRSFRAALLRRNRNFLAIDMESGSAVMAISERPHAPRKLVLRGISDFADERKQDLDRIGGGGLRTWALLNIAELLLTILETSVDFPNHDAAARLAGGPRSRDDFLLLCKELHSTIVGTHLPDHHRDLETKLPHLLPPYGRLFSAICESQWRPASPESFIADLAAHTRSSFSNATIRIDGLPGSGKSTLLSVLYIYLQRQFIADDTWPLPVYINLSHYETTSLGDIAVAEASFARDIEALPRLLQLRPGTKVVFIVDGIEEFSAFERSIEAFVLAFLDQHVPDCRIIGVALSDNRSDEYFFRDASQFGAPSLLLTLGSLDAGDARLRAFLQDFCLVAGDPDAAQSAPLLDGVERLKITDVDVLLASLLLSSGQTLLSRPSASLSFLLRQYCEEFLRNAGGEPPSTLAAAAGLAYRYAIRKEPLSAVEILGDPRWRLINHHAAIREFLLGYYVIEQLKAVAREHSDDFSQLSYVYPHRINRACKEIMNFTTLTQRQVLTALTRVYEHGSERCKPHVCYLAGRLENEDLRSEAKTFLQRCKEGFLRTNKQRLDHLTNQEGLLIRTIFISLVELGDVTSSNEYLLLLTRHPGWDDVNRGFHLEYYGDIPYDPQLDMSHRDRLGDFAATSRYLRHKILRKSANGRQQYPLLDIEAYTVLSLAQHRHANGRLASEARTELADLGKLLLERGIIRSREVRKFCRMIVRHLRRERFTCGNIAEELYQLKEVERSGWIKRGIAHPESVADHVYGAYLLALLYLPSTYPELRGYSKTTIINMLLVHELAEAYTGDILPEHKDEMARREEAEHFEYLALTGTYSGVDRMTPVTALWRAFQAGSDINAQIAKEMDKLENLMQLYIYRKKGHEIGDYVDWERGLCDAISTPIGLAVREIIRSAFPDIAGHVESGPHHSPPAARKRSASRPRRRRPAASRPRRERR